MINGIRAALNSKPVRIITPPILSGVAFGTLLFGPLGTFLGGIFGLFYQTLRTVAVFLSYDKLKQEAQTLNYLDETKKNAFNQGVLASDSYVEWAKTFLPGRAAYKEPIYYYAGLGAKMYQCDDKLIEEVRKIRTKP